jgi:hypothetical protein
LVHSDNCGPMPHQSLGRVSYFVTFIDNATWKVWAYPTRTKDRVFMIFKDWLTIVENQMDRKLKCLRCDNGGEYNSDEFVQFFRERGSIQERIVSMLHHSRRTDSFWAEALLMAMHIINMSSIRPLRLKIPQEL